jgi:hypothetical protein
MEGHLGLRGRQLDKCRAGLDVEAREETADGSNRRNDEARQSEP